MAKRLALPRQVAAASGTATSASGASNGGCGLGIGGRSSRGTSAPGPGQPARLRALGWNVLVVWGVPTRDACSCAAGLIAFWARGLPGERFRHQRGDCRGDRYTVGGNTESTGQVVKEIRGVLMGEAGGPHGAQVVGEQEVAGAVAVGGAHARWSGGRDS